MPRKRKSHIAPGELALLIAASPEVILADWLEEKLTLPATAALFRWPGVRDPPEQWTGRDSQLDHCALTSDVVLWLIRGHFHPKPLSCDVQPGVLIGLYAHPAGQTDAWVQLPRLLTGLAGLDAMVEAAVDELRAFALRQ